MIFKYYHKGAWGFIDNVSQIAEATISPTFAVERYEKKHGVKMRDGDCPTANNVFIAICDIYGGHGKQENLLTENGIWANKPVIAVLLYIGDEKMLIVTNQRAFLMNDAGQTVERLN